MNIQELSEKTLLELQEIAKENEVKSYSKYRKSELVELLAELLKEESEVPQAEPEEEKADETREEVTGVLEVLPDGYGFLRGSNYLSTNKDVYVSPAQIKRFNLKTGDKVTGNTRQTREGERFKPLIFVKTVNDDLPYVSLRRKSFESLRPVYPDKRITLISFLFNVISSAIDNSL